jgi:hypothetical protein
MAAASDRRGSDLLTFRAKRLPIKNAQINRARESTHDAVCCGEVSPEVALFGRHSRTQERLLLGEERKSRLRHPASESDPKETSKFHP